MSVRFWREYALINKVINIKVINVVEIGKLKRKRKILTRNKKVRYSNSNEYLLSLP